MARLRILGLVFATLACLSGCTEDQPLAPGADPEMLQLEKPQARDGEIRVMTWNIYVGADVDVVMEATNELDLAMRVAVAYESLQRTNFPERAKAIAAQVASYRPHLIGLQEVSLIQRIDPLTGRVIEEIDFGRILKNALQRRGLQYRVAGSVENADVTVPRLAGLENGQPVIDFVRLLDKDVALVREDVRVTESTKGRYAATLPLEGLGMEIPRGYVSIEAGVGQRKVRFVTTHLESATDLIRIPQAEELDKILGDERLPTIVVGDFNTLDPGPNNPLNDGTYQYLTGAAGLRDAWLLRAGHPNDRGFTSPHAPDLRNAPANLYERIDLVFLKNLQQTRGRGHHGSLQAEVIGEEEEDRTSSGMWPSDHAGVVVTLDGKIAD